MALQVGTGAWAFGVALDGTSLYWASPTDGTIRKVPKSGGTLVTLASGLQTPTNLVVDATCVYATSPASGAVIATAK